MSQTTTPQTQPNTNTKPEGKKLPPECYYG